MQKMENGKRNQWRESQWFWISSFFCRSYSITVLPRHIFLGWWWHLKANTCISRETLDEQMKIWYSSVSFFFPLNFFVFCSHLWETGTHSVCALSLSSIRDEIYDLFFQISLFILSLRASRFCYYYCYCYGCYYTEHRSVSLAVCLPNFLLFI